MSTLAEYDDLKREIKFRLVEYVQQHLGIQVSGRKKFKCPNPSHDDSSPSCVIYQNSNGPIIQCFSCGAHGDIFELHNIMTGAALSGPEFFTENLVPLAKAFGLEVPKKNLAPKDRYYDDVRRAYTSAEKLLTATPGSFEAQARITRYGWNSETRTQLGIGSVNWEYFAVRMCQLYPQDFLKKIGILESRLFGDHLLVFTIKDEHGQAVGFSSRNLFYEEAEAELEQVIRKFGPGSPEVVRLKAAIPPKYFNSVQGTEKRDGSPLLHKAERLLGFHRAKMGGAPLYVVEGNADVATAHFYGIRNCVGVGSAGLTVKQLELILKYEIPHVVLCLDADEGGRRGIKTFVNVLDQVKPPAWFLAEIMYLPAGEDDPDAFIRKFGPAAFEQLPKVDIFTWKINQMNSLTSSQDIANKVLQLIMDEASPYRRFRMSSIASPYLKVPASVIYDESYKRAGQPPAPVIRFHLKGGILVPDPAIKELLSEQQHINLIDLRATITLGTKSDRPHLLDDRVYYPIRTRSPS